VLSMAFSKNLTRNARIYFQQIMNWSKYTKQKAQTKTKCRKIKFVLQSD